MEFEEIEYYNTYKNFPLPKPLSKEENLELFLKKRIGYVDIYKIIEKVCKFKTLIYTLKFIFYLIFLFNY